jgi:hypothetical protein
MEFTYSFPDPVAFLHTVRELLEAEGKSQAASALIGGQCDFQSYGQFSRLRWNSYNATIVVRVPVASVPKFTQDVQDAILSAASRTLPSEAGYELTHIEVSPTLSSPPPDETPLNTGRLVSEAPIEHDGLRFRSRTEVRVYDELKRRNVLFFPNATAVLGGKNIKREPDFLVCLDGKWGILEVMGDRYHTGANAVQDHDRARLFKDYRILLIEFYDARKCYEDATSVVDDFLKRLKSTWMLKVKGIPTADFCLPARWANSTARNPSVKADAPQACFARLLAPLTSFRLGGNRRANIGAHFLLKCTV